MPQSLSRRSWIALGVLVSLVTTLGCMAQPVPVGAGESSPTTQESAPQPEPQDMNATPHSDTPPVAKTATATFGAGCFWCVEAVFQQLSGVHKVESGYTGGHVDNPTYREVCDGTTGHVEVCQITYDPEKIRFEQLLEVFWKTHDPTTPNQQGYDIGPQYRSAVFYHDDEQKKLAETYKQKLNDAKAFEKPIVTEIAPATKFYKAEDYHQNYFNSNPGDRYCRAIIQPKVDKVRKVFAEQLK